jgi:hypothetical protein
MGVSIAFLILAPRSGDVGARFPAQLAHRGARAAVGDSHISAALAPSRSTFNRASKQKCVFNLPSPTLLRIPHRNLAQN